MSVRDITSPVKSRHPQSEGTQQDTITQHRTNDFDKTDITQGFSDVFGLFWMVKWCPHVFPLVIYVTDNII